MEIMDVLANFSIFLVALTATLIYFGKLISDTKLQKYEKMSIMIEGLFFTLFYIFLPVVLNIFFYQCGFILQMFPWLVVLILFQILVSVIYRRYILYKNIKKFELGDLVNKEINKKIGEMKKNNKSIIGKILNRQSVNLNKLLGVFDSFFKLIEKGAVLFLFSVVIFYSVMMCVININILLFTAVSILSFLNLSLMAVARGTSNVNYPKSKITMVDGTIINGKVLKFDQYIYVIKKNKSVQINKEHVVLIEQNLIDED